MAVYLRDINRVPLLSPEEEKELGRRVQEGDHAAREQMIRANLRLVVSIAKKYTNRGLSLMDLIEEGNVGLMKAVERFDPAAETRFSTYGTWWIKQGIRRALVNTAKTVRVPSYMVEIISRFKTAQVELEDQLRRPPTIPEVASAMGMSPDNIHLVKRAIRTMNAGGTPVSLDALSAERDTLADTRTAPPDEGVLNAAELDKLGVLLDAIDPREAEILKLRFGIEEEGPSTLREIGERFGLSRERVRQIENRALRRLSSRFFDTDPDDDTSRGS